MIALLFSLCTDACKQFNLTRNSVASSSFLPSTLVTAIHELLDISHNAVNKIIILKTEVPTNHCVIQFEGLKPNFNYYETTFIYTWYNAHTNLPNKEISLWRHMLNKWWAEGTDYLQR